MPWLAKTWQSDGTVQDYQDSKYFQLVQRKVGGIRELSGLLTELERRPECCLIRGAYVGDEVAAQRDGSEYRPGRVRRTLDYFNDQPLHTVLVDVDGFVPQTVNPNEDPAAAIEEFITTKLPAEFSGVSYHWQLSNTFGHQTKLGQLRVHLWFWLETAYTSAQLYSWAKSTAYQGDIALLQTVQVHYTAAPKMGPGLVDPVAVRSGLVDGLVSDCVPLVIDGSIAEPVHPVGRRQHLVEVAQVDPIANALSKMGLVRSQARDGALNIVCPFADEHSTGKGGETSTQYFLPHTGGHAVGHFKCLHSTCASRERSAFLNKLGVSEGVEDFGGVANADPSATSGSAAWSRPADLFTQHPVPAFPMQAVPEPLAQHAASLAAQSGFDQGAYVYALLVAASGWIDQRARLSITDSFKVPAYIWGGLVDASGGGKSPVIAAATKFIKAIDTATVKDSAAMLQRWQADKEFTPKGERPPPRPTWRQRIVLDATVEAVADLLEDNPQGLVMLADEITEVVGRMDAYASGGAQGGSKDRGVFIRLFDGTPSSINRKAGHTFLEHATLSMLAGIQPEKLAELFRKSSSGGADGLYQRFLCFAMQPAAKADYEARVDRSAEASVREMFDQLEMWTQAGTFFQTSTALSAQARALANEYQNDIRLVAERTPARRLREHLNKFPGLLGRMTFTLHCIECAGRGAYRPEVEAATMARALQVMAVMFRHAEAVYSVLDTTTGDVQDLVRSAGELILSRRLSEFKRGDLTRGATGWQSAAGPVAEAAIDLLMDFDWIRDATGAGAVNRRGRKSMGTFAVNPQVHELFAEKSERIRAVRQERHLAIQRVGSERVGFDRVEVIAGGDER